MSPIVDLWRIPKVIASLRLADDGTVDVYARANAATPHTSSCPGSMTAGNSTGGGCRPATSAESVTPSGTLRSTATARRTCAESGGLTGCQVFPVLAVEAFEPGARM
jgi:hypothetical protein